MQKNKCLYLCALTFISGYGLFLRPAHSESNADSALASLLLSGVPSTNDMELIYRISALPSEAKSWLFLVAETDEVAEYGRPWNGFYLKDHELPYSQFQYALHSPITGHTALVFMRAKVEDPSEVRKELLLLSRAHPMSACQFGMHMEMGTHDSLDALLRPKEVLPMYTESELKEIFPGCKVRRRK